MWGPIRRTHVLPDCLQVSKCLELTSRHFTIATRHTNHPKHVCKVTNRRLVWFLKPFLGSSWDSKNPSIICTMQLIHAIIKTNFHCWCWHCPTRFDPICVPPCYHHDVSSFSSQPCVTSHAVKDSLLSQQCLRCVKLHHKTFVKHHDPERKKYNESKTLSYSIKSFVFGNLFRERSREDWKWSQLFLFTWSTITDEWHPWLRERRQLKTRSQPLPVISRNLLVLKC